MSEKSEAEVLADALDAWDGTLMMPAGWRQRTSAELRRLHELALEQQGKVYALEMARSMEQKTAKLKQDALLKALNMAVQWVEEYASQMRAYTISEQANADLSVIYAAIAAVEEGK